MRKLDTLRATKINFSWKLRKKIDYNWYMIITDLKEVQSMQKRVSLYLNN